jgi:hypothetical protein
MAKARQRKPAETAEAAPQTVENEYPFRNGLTEGNGMGSVQTYSTLYLPLFSMLYELALAIKSLSINAHASV